jgi:hypothetical protein
MGTRMWHRLGLVLIALVLVTLLGACAGPVPTASGSTGTTFLADDRSAAAAWYAERLWVLDLTQSGDDVRGTLTNVGPAVETGTAPQESTRLLEDKRDVAGTASGAQISVHTASDATTQDALVLELTGTLDDAELHAHIQTVNQPGSSARELVFRRVTTDEIASVQTDWRNSLNAKLGVQAEATLQARRNR